MSSVLVTVSSKMRLSVLLLCAVFIIAEVRGHKAEDNSKEVKSKMSPRDTSASGVLYVSKSATIKTTTQASSSLEVKGSTSNSATNPSTPVVAWKSKLSQPVTNTPNAGGEMENRTPQSGSRIITVLMNATANSITENESNKNKTATYLAIGILAGVALTAVVAGILLRCKSFRSSNAAQVKGQRAVSTPNPIYRLGLSGSQRATEGPYLAPGIIPPCSPGDYSEHSARSVSTDSGSKRRADQRHPESRRAPEPNYLDLLPD